MNRTHPKTDVDCLLRSMTSQSRKNAAVLPDRFRLRFIANRVRITDTLSNKSLEVGLCDAQGAYKAIGAFCS